MDINAIKAMHPTGLKGVFYVYNWEKLKQSQPFKFAVIVAIVLSILLLFNKSNYFLHAQAVIDLGLSIFPSLLGFTIGGYALIIGFASSTNLKKFTRKTSKGNGSFYQSLMSIFSVAILLQTLTITCCAIASYIIKSKFKIDFLPESELLIRSTNFAVTILIGFLSLWSLFTIPFVATNLFNFAQTNHLLGTIERIKEEELAAIEKAKASATSTDQAS